MEERVYETIEGVVITANKNLRGDYIVDDGTGTTVIPKILFESIFKEKE